MRRWTLSVYPLLATALCLASGGSEVTQPAGEAPRTAAPGYVADRSCAVCHSELFRSFQEVAMALSFYRPDPGSAIEDFDALPYHREPTQSYYGMRFRDGRLVFKRYQLAPDGTPINVDLEGEERSERFEINHHPYRLRQSRCYLESGGAIGCLTCHDPHRKVPAAERAAHYRTACFTCHQVEDCQLDEMAAGVSRDAHPADPADCVACHMAPRRPTDVVGVVMTDHFIRRRPGGPELLAPRDATEPVLVGAELMDQNRAPGGPLGEVYGAVAVLRARHGTDFVDYPEEQLAAASYRRVLAIDPAHDRAYLALGDLLRRRGRRDESLRWWRHGLRVAARTAAIAEALATAEAADAR